LKPTSSTSGPNNESLGHAHQPKVYRIFLSSPSDVTPERDAMARVVDRINAQLNNNARFQLIRWEDDFYTANSPFQAQIAKPSECDIVVSVFWKRLGTDLPDQYRRPDGSLPTGAEYEFEEAVQHAAQSSDKVPDVLVYRKTAEVLFSEANLGFEKAQWDRFLAFWRRWFRNEKGHFVAGFQSFENTSEFEVMVEAHILQWLKNRIGNVIWTRGTPFRGLKPFDVEHASIFFGRRRETERARARFLANALSGVHFLLIVGPSGSGKSSLLRAGLIPRLALAGGLEGLPCLSRRAIVTPALLTEGEHANWALGFGQALFANEALGPELAQGDFNTPERLAALLARGGAEAAAPLGRALERAATGAEDKGSTGLILVIDQLEEIFAWPHLEAEAFVACLTALTSSTPVYVIATMRSEFQHRLDGIPELAKLAAVRDVRGPEEPERVLDIGLPASADIRDMIDGPARAAGLSFAGAVGDLPDLLTRIERDSTPETLPALQYLLAQLYEHREGDVLTHAAYDALGGVTGVLTSRGEAVLAELGAVGEAGFPNLVRSLIRTGPADMPAVARRIRTNLFTPDSAEGRLASALRDAGLLISDRDTFRLAHESLITGWDRLGIVVAKEQRLFETRERLMSAYRRYEDIPATDRAARRRRLLQGLSLEEARDLLTQWGPVLLSDPLPGLPDFISASDREDRRRRLRHLAAAGAGSAVFAAAVLVALWFRAESAQSARSAEVRLELARAEAALRAQDWDRALDAATRAHSLADTVETRSMALTALMEHSSPHLAQRQSGPAEAARFTADGRLATLSRTGVLTLPGGRSVRLTEPSVPGAGYFDFAILPDGSFVVLTTDGRVGLVDAQRMQASSDSLQPTWLTSGGYVLALARQADIHVNEALVRIAVADGGLTPGRLLTCGVTSVRNCTEIDLPAELRALAISPNGRQLAIAGDTWLRLLDLEAPNTNSTQSLEGLEGGSIRSLGWAAGGAIVLAGTDQGEVIAIAQSNAALEIKSRNRISMRPIGVQNGAPSGMLSASSCDEGFLCLLTFDELGTLRGQSQLYHIPNDILRLAWSSDGRRVASVHADRQLRIWDSAPQDQILEAVSSVSPSLTSLAVDRRDGRIAAGDAEGNIWIWPGGSEHKQPRRIAGESDEVVHLAFSLEGTLAAAFKNGDLARIPRDPNAAVLRVASNSNIQRVAWLSKGTLAATTPAEIILLDAAGSLSRHDIGALKPGQTIGGLLSIPGDAGVIVSVSDGTLLRWEPGRPAQPLLPNQDSSDALSALSLAFHPSGRWLTSTRADDQLRVYDATARIAPRSLPLTSRDSKVVAFSPDGNQLTALMSDDRLQVWHFDPHEGRAEQLVSVLAVPTALQAKSGQGSPRQARWIDWIDGTHLGIASRAGPVLILSFDRPNWTARLNALRP